MIVRQVEFLRLMLLISRQHKVPLRVNDNYTHHKSWQIFFVWRNSLLAIYSIHDSFHVGLFIKNNQENKKQFSRFGKQNVMVKCSVKCQLLTNPKTQKLQ